MWLYILTQKFILSAKVQNHYDELKFLNLFKRYRGCHDYNFIIMMPLMVVLRFRNFASDIVKLDSQIDNNVPTSEIYICDELLKNSL